MYLKKSVLPQYKINDTNLLSNIRQKAFQSIIIESSKIVHKIKTFSSQYGFK